MKNFIILTRGRTGSTAIMDSLNKTRSIATAQELFIKYKAKENGRSTKKIGKIIPRYDLWRHENMGFYPIIREKLMRSDTSLIKYLDQVETSIEQTGAQAFGFKVISHHFKQRPKLQENLLKRGYTVLYLTRNIPRQVISGMVAKQRGKYNAHENENYRNDSTYFIDIDNFISLIEEEKKAHKNLVDFIESSGVDHTVITYEDFVVNRDQFFLDIFSFLKITPEKAPPSSYTVMIENLKDTIKNYDQVCDSTKQLGMTLE